MAGVFVIMQNSILEKIKQPFRWIRSWWCVLYNGYPAKRLKVIGVTGTDGKTTTCWLIYEIFKVAGYKVGMITTVGIKYNDKVIDTGLHVTNPDAKVVQGLFKKMADEGIEVVIIEVTSHRLAQLKTMGYNTQVAVLTNLTREHLDYHGDMQRYAEAKARLFRRASYAVLNADDEWFEYFKAQIPVNNRQRIIDYAKTNIREISLALGGEYNKYNIGAAEAVAKIFDIKPGVVFDVVKNFSGVPGRRERVQNNLGIGMIVDFAHTPNGLEQLLKSLMAEKAPKAKLILVFGCTGERDKGKRPEMGLVAEKYADEIIVTADDPRGEDLGKIYSQIISKFESRNPKFIREDDRDKAIEMAVKMARRGDIVVAAGMGHEQTILIGKNENKRSDRVAFEKVA